MRRYILVVGLMLAGGACSGDMATTTAAPSPVESTSSSAPIACHPSEPDAAAAGEWASFGFDDANSRHNRAETRIGPDNVACLEVLWSIEDLGGVSGTPVVLDGIVYFGDWNGSLHAVEAETGAVVWEEQITTERVSRVTRGTPSPTSITATVLVSGDRVFLPDMDGFLHARDRNTGLAVWTVEVDDQPAAAIFSAPVLIDGMLIIGVGGNDSSDRSLRGSVVAVDADTGDLAWRLPMTDDVRTGVWTSAAVDRDLGLVFFGTGDSVGLTAPLANALVAIDYQTGELLWHNVLNSDDQIEADVAASPNLFSIDDRQVVGVGAKNGLFRVVDRQTGAEVWSVQLADGAAFGEGVYSTAALGDGVIYVNSASTDSAGSITLALGMNDGAILWERPFPGPAYGSMTLANGVLFHGTVAGTIYALDASNGAILWTSELPGNFGDGVSVANGMLFVGYGFSPEFAPVTKGGIVAYALP